MRGVGVRARRSTCWPRSDLEGLGRSLIQRVLATLRDPRLRRDPRLGPASGRPGSRAWITTPEARSSSACSSSRAWPPAGRTRRTCATARPVDGGLAVTMIFSLVYISYAYTGWNARLVPRGRDPRPADASSRGRSCSAPAVVTRALPRPERRLRAGPLGGRRPRHRRRPGAAQAGLDAVAPIAEIAARRLFGASWSDPLSRGDRPDAPVVAQRLPPDRAPRALRDGPGRPVPGDRRPAPARAGTPAVATVLQVA